MEPTDGHDRTLTPDQAETLPVTPAEGLDASVQPPPQHKLGRVLGRGGMGEVLLAADLAFGRDVAVKRMRSAAPSPEAVTRFLREAKIQARLDHPAIVPVHTLGYDDAGRPYFTMKRLSGTTLADVLAAGSQTLQKLLRAFVDLCLAIDFAHNRGFIHRDLKPGNIMLGDYGEVYVLDWGVARQVGEADPQASHWDHEPESLGGETQAGAVLGTPGYMSPEQLLGDEVGPSTDIYALGAILFEVLVGTPVHPRGQPAIASTLAGGWHSPITRSPERAIAPELDELCSEALAETAAKRPTARALADAVQMFLDGDRDLVSRQAYASKLLASAQADLDSGDPMRRASAMKSAGHALALDQTSEAAARLVTQLILEPPRDLPPALVARLEAADQEQMMVQGKLATYALMSYLVFAPLLLWMGVREWAVVGTLLVLITGGSLAAALLPRQGGVHVWFALIINAAILLLISRLTSPFLLLPGIVAGSAASFAAFPRLMHRPGLVIGLFTAVLLLPVGFESLGLWGRTWEVVDGRYIATPTAVAFDGVAATMFLIAASVGITAVLALFVRSLAISQRAGRRLIEIQAWHLHQLIKR